MSNNIHRIKFKDNNGDEKLMSPYDKKKIIASPYLPDRPNNVDLAKGIVWAEILGPPVSKRQGRGRRGL